MLFSLFFAVLLTSTVAIEFPKNFAEDDLLLDQLSDNISKSLSEHFLNNINTETKTVEFKKLVDQLKAIRTGSNLKSKDFYKCTTCRAAIDIFQHILHFEEGRLTEPTKEIVLKNAKKEFCRTMGFKTEEVCSKSFDINQPSLQYIILNTKMAPKTICGVWLHKTFCKVTQEEFNWSVKIDPNGPLNTGPKSDIPKKSSRDLRILHLTDVHYDPKYKPGRLAGCNEPVCCQRELTSEMDPKKGAGKWSDYRRCDTPWEMYIDVIQHIKKNHPKIDYIYYTGDIVDHAGWTTSEEHNKESVSKIMKNLKEEFGDIPIFPILGNHEAYPPNLFAPPDAPEDLNVQWLFNHVSDLWSLWLPKETEKTIKDWGYYTVSPRRGFRIIALNNNDCYFENWWIFYDGQHLSKQLEWLQETLLAAEKAGEYVHILAHVPSGLRECWNVWAREFTRIVERYSNTISGIFNGHTHADEMNVFYSKTNHSNAINIAWNGGCLTTFANKNPNYRIYDVEPTTMQVVEHETWIFNVTEANEHPDRSPIWFQEYIFGEEYGLKDLSPSSIDKLLDRFAGDPQLLRKYWEYKFSMSDPKLASGCSNNCLLTWICDLASSDPERLERCKELQEKLRKSLALEQSGTNKNV